MVVVASRVEIEMHAYGFRDASQAKTVFDSATPQVVGQVQNKNGQLKLIVRKQQDGTAGGAFVRKVWLAIGR